MKPKSEPPTQVAHGVVAPALRPDGDVFGQKIR